MILEVPFYSNLDDTHCLQAVMKMILKYFEPEKDYSWVELDKLSAHRKGKWAWPTAMMINFHRKGYKVILREDWNFQRFVDRGEDFLIEKYGEDVAKEQISNSDIFQERRLAKKFLETGILDRKIPESGDITEFLKEGYLVVCNVNSKLLNNQAGYEGHFVLVTGFDNLGFTLNGPYSPEFKNRHVAFDKLEQSWAYPSPDVKNIIAIKK